ncbi:putative cleavage and polyadenylation factor 2 C-terminal [Lyophyllum shimeji]|uniref:Cleavage and polyadenylation specificity factor subunit 2 n=1 Tax=Lyophyllum shimeji TaxID=47721 RepID=A0A9P3PDP4_LYOSH|nr:putative cleavage and polyadenylation factor 2 C-terminal [Lyophyllum shimeji]
MITFTPLSGAARSSQTKPLAYLLQVDDVRILLDCGSPDWAPEPAHTIIPDGAEEPAYHWETYCNALRECAPTIDLVLLSHGDLAHTGLYPYAYSRWGLKAPAYTTLPVQAMGRIAVSEDVEGIREEEDVGDELETKLQQPSESMDVVEGPSTLLPKKEAKRGKYVATLAEVQDAFDSINTLRYSQPTHLQGKCQGLTIIPFNAGHTLGGTIWKIRSPSSGTILYAVNINHMKERHLDGTVLMRQAAAGVFEPLARPDLLITDADRADVVTSRRKDRDAALIDTITATLSSRSSILLPCDSSTRVLELLVLLDQHWNYARLRYPICFLSQTGREMLTFVRSMMEWLGGTVSKEDVGEEGTSTRHGKRRRDDDGDEDAFGAFALRFKHLEFFRNPQALLQTYSSKDPKLILAVPASLSHGPARNLFADFAAVPDNVVLLTGRGEEGTLGRDLFERWNDAQRPDDKWDKGKIGSNIMMDGALRLRMNHKVPLQGAELEAYQQKERAAREKEAAQQAAIARNRRMLEADEVDSDEESDSDAEDEDEVRQALEGDLMDTEADGGAEVVGTRRKADRETGDVDWGIDGDEGLTRQLSFDIYLKGNVSKATSFFKSAGGQTQRFRMFPYVEKKRRVDEYGETIDVGTWLRKGKVLEEEAETDEAKDYRLKTLAEEDARKAIKEPPSKFVSSEIEVQLACRLLFLDMEGLNDGRAVKTIIPQINPRKMIIVHAPPHATDVLIESCATIRAMTKDIYAPAVGESVQIGQQISSFSLSISDELLKTLNMSRFEDNEVGYVTGRIVAHANSTIPVLEPISAGALPKVTTGKEVTRPRPLGARPTVTLPQSTMIGELKLTALKARLAAIGVQAELIGEGVLICGAGAKRNEPADTLEESVAVRKTAAGKVELEGNVSEVYYTVRREIYKLHALVAAA